MYIWVYFLLQICLSFFGIIRNSKMNWKICLWWIFHINPYYKFLKWYTYLKFDHFIAHIFLYHFLTFLRKFRKLDGSHGRHLLVVRTGNIMSYFVFVTVFLLFYTVYVWNCNFLWVRDGYSMSVMGNFLKDTVIFIKQLQLKVCHNGKV